MVKGRTIPFYMPQHITYDHLLRYREATKHILKEFKKKIKEFRSIENNQKIVKSETVFNDFDNLLTEKHA